MSNSYKTAISRKTLSAPAKWLLHNLIEKDKTILDFGCGKGFDVTYLKKQGFNIEGYDPHFSPILPESKFDIILCTYVLNTLEEEASNRALEHAKSFLKGGGTLYVTVRCDKFKKGYNGRGTYQRCVSLDLPIVFENSRFKTYEYSS